MMIKKRLLVCLVLSLGCIVSAANADVLRTVAFSGNRAPGTDVHFSTFRSPVLNNTGQTAFQGSLAGSEISFGNNSGIWSEGNGALALIAREGNAAPGTSENYYELNSNTNRPILNEAGQTAFSGFLTDSTGNRGNQRGIWSEGKGALALVAREGSSAPGINGDFSRLYNPVFNNAGQTAFRASLAGAAVENTSDSGIWSEGGGSLGLVAHEGSMAPGTSANFSDFGSVSGFFSDPLLNGSGQLAFIGHLTGSGVNLTNRRGVWSEGRGSLALVARVSNPGPISGIRDPVFNDAGQTAFLAGRFHSISSSILLGERGSLAVVVSVGDEAPGTSGGFGGFNKLVLNGLGQTAFHGFIGGPGISLSNNVGIWSEGSGSLALVARAGDKAPGTLLNFAFPPEDRFGKPVLNSAGQTAFLGILTGSGANGSNDKGIWAQDLSGELTLIARLGDLLDVDDGPGTDFRTISSLGFVEGTGNEDGRASGFNDLGQLAFNASFTDGTSGIFVSNLVAVPEPSSLTLLALAGLTMWRRELRR